MKHFRTFRTRNSHRRFLRNILRRQVKRNPSTGCWMSASCGQSEQRRLPIYRRCSAKSIGSLFEYEGLPMNEIATIVGATWVP